MAQGQNIMNDSMTGVPEGGTYSQGKLSSGITSDVGMMTGAAPCWQCAPQPTTVNERTDKNRCDGLR